MGKSPGEADKKLPDNHKLKTRFWLKPNLMQCTSKTYPTSFVVTDPKGSILIECGKMLQKFGYRIRFLNTINMKKSMHYNPPAYVRNEADILKFVNTLISNTKADCVYRTVRSLFCRALYPIYCHALDHRVLRDACAELQFCLLPFFIIEFFCCGSQLYFIIYVLSCLGHQKRQIRDRKIPIRIHIRSALKAGGKFLKADQVFL